MTKDINQTFFVPNTLCYILMQVVQNIVTISPAMGNVEQGADERLGQWEDKLKWQPIKTIKTLFQFAFQ